MYSEILGLNLYLTSKNQGKTMRLSQHLLQNQNITVK